VLLPAATLSRLRDAGFLAGVFGEDFNVVRSTFMKRVAIAIGAFVCGCSTSPPAVCQAPQGAPGAAQALAEGDLAFGLALYAPSASPSQNFIVSPYSVSSVLTMVAAGAKGETASQMQTVLHLPSAPAALAPAYAALACEGETDGTSDGQQLVLANALWAQQGEPFEPAFLSLLSKGYGAPLQEVDFAANTASAVSAINTWISTETEGQIPALLGSHDITRATRLVLVNAVYFHGTWPDAFDPSMTAPQTFTLETGESVMVPTMSGSVLFRGGNGFGTNPTVVELPYLGGGLALDILMPSGPLAAFEAGLTPASLAKDLALLTGEPSQNPLLLPKFTIDSELSLIRALEAMGMVDVFDPAKADLSGIDGAHDLFIDLVKQDATIEVDESGTVAAAATAGGGGAGFEIGPVAIDRPFVFLIRDVKNGSVLFMGRVLDPRG
jgi:serpin B